MGSILLLLLFASSWRCTTTYTTVTQFMRCTALQRTRSTVPAPRDTRNQ
ncbi:hypothetical protein M758_6G206700 [Ceratodon purpureus]|uniref:Uncharacterized protein n=1 Tax=Ceratodon purpureus TaxID=3225 RepID=A0A8T0HK27_CERPU|nr:hypothetical protein KC19_6G215800 [Ceratodon purpureus]KAG0614829.1 hypothetical protein M758_6G206700 [Ceratodon purpureus]